MLRIPHKYIQYNQTFMPLCNIGGEATTTTAAKHWQGLFSPGARFAQKIFSLVIYSRKHKINVYEYRHHTFPSHVCVCVYCSRVGTQNTIQQNEQCARSLKYQYLRRSRRAANITLGILACDAVIVLSAEWGAHVFRAAICVTRDNIVLPS